MIIKYSLHVYLATPNYAIQNNLRMKKVKMTKTLLFSNKRASYCKFEKSWIHNMEHSQNVT